MTDCILVQFVAYYLAASTLGLRTRGGSLEEATEATPPRDFPKKIKIYVMMKLLLKNICFKNEFLRNVCLSLNNYMKKLKMLKKIGKCLCT